MIVIYLPRLKLFVVTLHDVTSYSKNATAQYGSLAKRTCNSTIIQFCEAIFLPASFCLPATYCNLYKQRSACSKSFHRRRLVWSLRVSDLITGIINSQLKNSSLFAEGPVSCCRKLRIIGVIMTLFHKRFLVVTLMNPNPLLYLKYLNIASI